IVCAAVSSPLLKLVMEVPSWKRWLADRLNRWSPRLRLESGISPQVISRTPEVVTAYANDPFCGGKVSVRWFQEINRGMAQAQADVKKIAVPLLVMQAGADQLVDPRQADVFFKSLQPHEEHEYTVYPECYHELFNEPEQQQVIDQLVKWLDARTATT
ncbi:MAG: serine aminopeptidase domain-containing protein, partial [Tumebacillaceae bacterium]